jgi:hypothetical protein
MIGAHHGELEDVCWVASDNVSVGSAMWVCDVLGVGIGDMRERVGCVDVIRNLTKLYPHLRYPRRLERATRVGVAEDSETAIVAGPTRMMLPGFL